MTREEYERLNYLFDNDPDKLSGQQKEFIAGYRARRSQKIQRTPTPPGFNLKETVNQMVSGFISGVTALGNYADEPRNSWEAIANSIGHLGGFVGMIWPGVSVGKGISRGVGALGRAFGRIGAPEAARTIYGAEQALQRFRSVPMLAADVVMRAADKRVRSNATRLALGIMEDKPIMQQALASGGHLGTAMFVSELHKGLTDALQSGAFGMLMGGFFDAGLGNIPFLKSETTPAKVMKAMAGGISNTLTPTLMGQNPFNAPIEMVIYDALLGGYFGWHAKDVNRWAATRYISRRLQRQEMQGYESDKEFRELPEATRNLIVEGMKKNKIGTTGEIFSRVMREFTPILAETPEILPGQRVFIEGDNLTAHYVKEIRDNRATLSSGKVIDVDLLTPVHASDPVLLTKRTETNSGLNTHDYDGLPRNRANQFREFLRGAAIDEKGKRRPPRMSPEEAMHHEYNMLKKAGEVIARKKQDPEYQDLADIKAFAYGTLIDRKLRPLDKEMTPREWAPLIDWYTELLYSVPVEYQTYNVRKGTLSKNTPAYNGDQLLDPQGKRREGWSVRPLFAYLQKEGRPVRWGVVASAEDKDFRKQIFTTNLVRAKLGVKDYGNMARILDAQGQGLIGGREGGNLFYVEYGPKEELNQVWIEAQGISKKGELDRLVEKSAQRLGVSPQIVQRNIANNIWYYKHALGGGEPLSEIFSGKYRFIDNIMDWNKRFGAITQKYLPIHPQAVPEVYRKFRYLIVEDPNKDWDGMVISTKDMRDVEAEAIGLPKGRVGATKFFYIEPSSGLGTHVAKLAQHAVGKEMSDLMAAEGLDKIFFTSASKASGKRTVHKMEYRDGKLVFTKPDGTVGKPDIYYGDIENVLMSRDIYDDSFQKVNQPRRLVKQLDNGITDVAVARAMGEFRASAAKGSAAGNNVLSVYRQMSKDNVERARAYLRENHDAIDFMNRKDAEYLMRTDPVFRSEFIRHRAHAIEDPLEELEVSIESGHFQDALSPQYNVDKLIAAGFFDSGIMSQKFAADVVDNMQRRYFVDDIVRPKIMGAGSARLSKMDPITAMKYKLDDNSFYLGPEWRGFKFTGIDAKGNNVANMTLGDQWKLLEPFYTKIEAGEQLSPVESDTFKSMQNRVRFVVTRLPIDNPSGILRLDFRGFVPIEGGNVYVSKKNMDNLGDADFDIDAAYFYSNLPESYQKWVDQQKGRKDRHFAMFGDVNPGDPAEQFFADRPADEPYDDVSKFAMFDPYHIAQTNRATSIGRGENLPRSVAFSSRGFPHQNYLRMQEKGRPRKHTVAGNLRVDIPRTEDEQILSEALMGGSLRAAADAAAGGVTGKRLPLDAFDARKYLIRGLYPEMSVRIGNNTYKIYDRSSNQLVPDPQTGGKRLMPLKELEEAALDIIAGKRIYPMRNVQGQWRSVGPKSGIKASAMKEQFNKRQNRHWQGIRIGSPDAGKVYSGEDLFKKLIHVPALESDPFYARRIDLDSKWYRSDYRKPWTSDKVHAATMNYLQLGSVTEPKFYVAQAIKDHVWGGNLAWSIVPTMKAKDAYRNWDLVLNELNALEPFFPDRLTIPYENIQGHTNTLKKFGSYDPGRESLGIFDPAQRWSMGALENNDRFMEFIDSVQENYNFWRGKPREAFIQWIEGNIPGKDGEPRSKSDQYKINFTRDRDPLYVQRQRAGYLEDYLNMIGDFISERISTLASVRSMIQLVHEMNVDPKIFNEALTRKYSVPTAWGTETTQKVDLVKLGTEIKQVFYKEKAKDIEEEGGNPHDVAQVLVRDGHYVAGKIAKDLGVSPEKMQEFYEALLLSPIRGKKFYKGERPVISTGETRMALDYVSDRALHRFAKNYNEAHELFRSGSELERIKEYYKMLERSLVDDDKAVFQRTLWPKDSTPAKYDPEVERLMSTLTWYLSESPAYQDNPQRFVSMLLTQQGIAQPKDMTVYDLYGMLNHMRELKYGNTLLNMIFPKKPLREGKSWGWIFPDTLGKKDIWDDFRWVHLYALGPEGTGDRYATPVYYYDEKRKRYGAYKDSWVLTSTMQDTNAIGNYVKLAVQTEKTRLADSMKELSSLVKARNLTTREEGAYELFKYAGWLRELDGINRDLQDLNDPHKRFNHNEAALRGRENHYRDKDQLMRAIVKWEKEHLGKVYHDADIKRSSGLNRQRIQRRQEPVMWSYQEGGTSRKVTAPELMRLMQDWMAKTVDEGHGGLGDQIWITGKWLRENATFDALKFRTTGMIDLENTLNRARYYTQIQPEHIQFPWEYGRLAQYLQGIKTLSEYPLLRSPRNEGDIIHWRVEYLKDLQDKAKEAKITGMSVEELNDWSQKIRKEYFKGNKDVTEDLFELATRWKNYTSTSYHPRDWRMKFFGDTPREAISKIRELVGNDLGVSMLRADRDYYNGRLLYPEWAQHTYMGKTPYLLGNRIRGYIPHRMHEPKIALDWVKTQKRRMEGLVSEGKMDAPAFEKGLKDLDRIYHGVVGKESVYYRDPVEDVVADAYVMMGAKDNSFYTPIISQIASKTHEMMRRTANVPGYQVVPLVFELYHNDLIDNKYRMVQGVAYQKLIGEHEKRSRRLEKAGKIAPGMTDAMQHQLKMYARQSMDLPAIYSERELNDPILQLKKTPAWWLSDHAALVKGTMAYKWFAKLMGADRVTDGEKEIWGLDTPEKIREYRKRKLDELVNIDTEKLKNGIITDQDRHKIALATRLFKRFSQFEARYELSSLLASLKTSIANLAGGNVHTVIMHGFNNWRKAQDINEWIDIQGKPGANLGGQRWRSMNDVYRWVEDLGVIQDIVLQDAQLRQLYTTPQAQGFLDDAINAIKRDPDLPDTSLADLATKHGLDKAFLDKAGWFMRKSERRNRMNAFLTGWYSMYKSLDPSMVRDLNLPLLVEAGRRTIAMTQFLYDNVNRPGFAATNLGHVYSRFKLWMWSSTRFQREIFNEAAKRGFAPYSQEAERFERLALANMFMMGLASLLPYTIFESTLPGPLSTMQNLSDWAFGDENERDRAFFGQSNLIFKGWLAPINEVLPPVTRAPSALNQAFQWIFDEDRKLLDQYLVWSSIPFGRISRDVWKAYNNPVLAAQFLAGLPLTRLQRLRKDMENREGNHY